MSADTNDHRRVAMWHEKVGECFITTESMNMDSTLSDKTLTHVEVDGVVVKVQRRLLTNSHYKTLIMVREELER